MHKVIIGAGRHAAEVFSLMEDLGQDNQLLAFAKDDVSPGELFMGKPVMKIVDVLAMDISADKPEIMVGIGDVPANKRISDMFRDRRFTFFNLLNKGIKPARFRALGTGVYIAEGTIVTVNISVGDNVILNNGCTVSHDCSIGSFVNISPGTHIAGWVTIEDDVFVGVGASFIPKIRVGKGSIIAAGACVTKDVPPYTMVAGVPARIKKNL